MTDFTKGLAVVSSARKLIFRVPQGPVVNFLDGAALSEYGQNNAAPVIVVLNHVDQSAPGGTWQGADAQEGIVIMNNVPETVALELLDLFEQDQTINGLNVVITRAEVLGCLDNYTTTVQFVEGKLSPAGRMLDAHTGIVKRDDRDVCFVVRDGNGVIQRKLGDDIRHIDSDDILVRDYVNADGTQIDLATIPVA